MSFWQEKIKFKNLSVPRFMAAPLDGITDSPMRQLIREFSPEELLFTEMRHVACVANEKTGKPLKFEKVEHPLAFQFSANNTEFVKESVEKLLKAKKVEMINLNVGCPARSVVRSGGGSALMGDPKRLKEIIFAFKEAIPENIPFTIKIRSGFKIVNALEISKLSEGLGVDGIIIHPRTQVQGFTSLPDTDLVREIKQVVKIPVVFSGNINSFARAQKVYEKTGVDGFMIGRALWGCPWKMKEISLASENKNIAVNPIEYAIKHLKLILEFYGEHGHNCFKKQLAVYTKGIHNATEIRQTLFKCKSSADMFLHLKSLLKNEQKAQNFPL